MKRVPEPELMDSPAQARAYAEADFNESNTLFTELFVSGPEKMPEHGSLVDLGCGPADICIRIARRLPGWRVTGLDAGENMLRHAREAVAAAGLDGSIRLHLAHLPETGLPAGGFDAVTSNSLLHHLPGPAILWDTVTTLGRPGAAVTVMDLARPASLADVQRLVDHYAAGEPEVLREDFFNSLCAAYTVEEVRAQLDAAGLGTLRIERPSDRHWVVRGRLAG